MHARTWLSVLSLPLVGAFTMPVLQRGQAPQAAVKPGAKSGPVDPLAGLSDIQDVLGLVQQNYVDAPDMEKVVSGGIQAVLERSHPLNAYLSPEDLRMPAPGPAEAGLMLMKRGIYAVAVAVTPGGPAAKAGIQPGDVIRKVDGDSVGRLSAWTLERLLKGAPGSTLDLYRYNAAGELTKTSVERQLPAAAPVALKSGSGALLVTLPDLKPGRVQELKNLLAGQDRGLTLVLDLRACLQGDFQEAAALAGLLGAKGAFATVQEAGKPDREVAAGPAAAGFSRTALLVGRATVGAPEVLASCLKKGGAKVVGERTAGIAVERTRFLLKQGGAVELVNRRWVGLGGEKLDRQGVAPDQALRLAEGEDPLPKVLAALTAPAPAKAS